MAFSIIAPSVAAQTCENCTLAAVDWTTLPSTYTHRDGQRVDQFEEGVQPTTFANDLRQTSIYRYHRSSLQGTNSVDHYHRVDRVGDPVQPYGEWRYPYRPYSVPYQAWGPQLPQFYSNANVGGFGYGPNWPYAGVGQPGAIPFFNNPNVGPRWNQGWGNGLIPGPANALPPELDEYYPEPPQPPPMTDRDFFYSPIRP